MTFAENLMELRRQRGLSQEQLGAEIGVSRQTISKWELGSTTPELEKLMELSDFFDISIDRLVGHTQEQNAVMPGAHVEAPPQTKNYGRWHYEYKSRRELLGLPLVHIHVSDHGVSRAKGIIAVGNVATGVIAFGGVAAGAVSLGGVSLGLLALGGGALGLLSIAGLALGVFSWGGLAVGYMAVGGLAVGIYAMGGYAVGARAAMGSAGWSPKLLLDDGLRNEFLRWPAAQQQTFLENAVAGAQGAWSRRLIRWMLKLFLRV